MTDDAWAPLVEAPITATTAKERLFGLGYNSAAPADVLVSLFEYCTPHFLRCDDLPPEVLDAGADHPARRVWTQAAESGRLSAGQWDRLLARLPASPLRDSMAELAHEMLVGRSPSTPVPTTPAEIAAMEAAVPEPDLSAQTFELGWVRALHHDADAMRQLAASRNVVIRRSVARAEHLPPDVLELLARDEDRVVHLFLAESNVDAPPEMLLSVWTWWDGSLSHPGIPRSHPNFPRRGLLRFAEHPDPRMRRLALDDPASTPDLVERFSRDPDPGVRGDAAGDLRLSPGSAARLAGDPDRRTVSWRAWRNPVLPAEVLVSLLIKEGDGEPAWLSIHHAAQNPAIPPEVMRRMVQRARPAVTPEQDR